MLHVPPKLQKSAQVGPKLLQVGPNWVYVGFMLLRKNAVKLNMRTKVAQHISTSLQDRITGPQDAPT